MMGGIVQELAVCIENEVERVRQDRAVHLMGVRQTELRAEFLCKVDVCCIPPTRMHSVLQQAA